MMQIVEAILAINSNAQVNVIGDNLSGCTIQWNNGTSEISKADIASKMTELQTAYDNNAYQRKRADEYPEIKEQLDLLYKDMLADKGDKSGAWFAAVKSVKDKYAKG